MCGEHAHRHFQQGAGSPSKSNDHPSLVWLSMFHDRRPQCLALDSVVAIAKARCQSSIFD